MGLLGGAGGNNEEGGAYGLDGAPTFAISVGGANGAAVDRNCPPPVGGPLASDLVVGALEGVHSFAAVDNRPSDSVNPSIVSSVGACTAFSGTPRLLASPLLLHVAMSQQCHDFGMVNVNNK